MWQRAFVVLPLAEIAPDLVSPTQAQAVAGQGLHRLGG
jgi:2-amino-4-hydroxy-6-hydroxymethyldihydropteridine diphosphokinase